MEFKVGHVYHRQSDIHGRYGGQQQGGMSTPKRHPAIFLFTGEGGTKHGYRDRFKPDDGVFLYTGEGQRGDMAFVRANRALRDHREDGKRVFLFENVAGGVRHVGEVSVLGYRREDQPDTDGELRQAIVFELALEPDPSPSPQVEEPSVGYQVTERRPSLSELRRLALAGASAAGSVEERRQTVRVRSEAIRAYVLRRAGGTCEGCGEPAPFVTRQRTPYLEAHHTTRVADGGPDHPAHVVALCPTCHRRVHHAADGDDYNRRLVDALRGIEPS